MNINRNFTAFCGKVMSGDELSAKRCQEKMTKPGMPEMPMPPLPRFESDTLAGPKPYMEADRDRVKAAIAKNSDLVEKMKPSKIDIGFFDNTSYLYLKDHILAIKPRIPLETLNHFVKRIMNHVLQKEEAIIDKFKEENPYYADKV